MAERLLVRILVAVCLGLAVMACALVPIPMDLPPPAFEQATLYRLETALMFFYGSLLLVTPAFSGLVRGRLPIEISTRGARFATEADESAARNEAAVRKLEGTARQLAQSLKATQLAVDALKELADSDSTQPGVDSKA